MASTKAKPKMALLNNSLRIEGLRETPNTKLANTIPIPKAAPPKAIEAKPAPIIFPNNNIILNKKKVSISIPTKATPMSWPIRKLQKVS